MLWIRPKLLLWYSPPEWKMNVVSLRILAQHVFLHVSFFPSERRHTYFFFKRSPGTFFSQTYFSGGERKLTGENLNVAFNSKLDCFATARSMWVTQILPLLELKARVDSGTFHSNLCMNLLFRTLKIVQLVSKIWAIESLFFVIKVKKYFQWKTNIIKWKNRTFWAQNGSWLHYVHCRSLKNDQN